MTLLAFYLPNTKCPSRTRFGWATLQPCDWTMFFLFVSLLIPRHIACIYIYNLYLYLEVDLYLYFLNYLSIFLFVFIFGLFIYLFIYLCFLSVYIYIYRYGCVRVFGPPCWTWLIMSNCVPHPAASIPLGFHLRPGSRMPTHTHIRWYSPWVFWT